jgi:hypothetical protein
MLWRRAPQSGKPLNGYRASAVAAKEATDEDSSDVSP